MLRELSGADWMSILQLTEDEIPEVLVLRGTRNLRRHYLAFAEQLAEVREVGSPNGLFEDVLIGRHENRLVGYASVYGPAMASEITHVFGKMGTRVAIQTGVCGALSPDLQAGDVVVASGAGCGDGAVACYLPDVETIAASDRLNLIVRGAAGDENVRFGPVWTTAALLAEGTDDLVRWAEAGYVAVDMETAATFGVAEWTGMERISILSVFDNPLAGEHLGLGEQHKAERRTRGEDQARNLVRDLIRSV